VSFAQNMKKDKKGVKETGSATDFHRTACSCFCIQTIRWFAYF
jgi:hypothetical protein